LALLNVDAEKLDKLVRQERACKCDFAGQADAAERRGRPDLAAFVWKKLAHRRADLLKNWRSVLRA